MPLDQQLVTGLPLQAGNTLNALAGTAAAITYTVFGVEAYKDQALGQFSNRLLAQGQLGVADAAIYTVPPSALGAALSAIYLVNTTGLAVAGVKLAFNGASSSAAYQILPSLTIPADGFAVLVDGILRVYDSGGNLYQTSTSTSFDATLPSVTTPLILSGVVGTAATAARRDHQHQSPGGIASIVAASAAIVDTEVAVVSATCPAGLLQAGTVLRIRAFGFITSTVDNVVTFNVRVGPVTLTGTIPAALAVHCGNSGTVTAAGFVLEVMVTVRTAGAGGTCYGTGFVMSLSSGAAVSQALALANEMFTPASVAVDTTGANIAQLTCVTAAATTAVTFQTAVIEVVKM